MGNKMILAEGPGDGVLAMRMREQGENPVSRFWHLGALLSHPVSRDGNVAMVERRGGPVRAGFWNANVLTSRHG